MTKVINIADLRKAPLVTIVDEDGTRHNMVTASVETFLENVEAIESLGLSAGPKKELEVIIGIVLRGFPTLDEKTLRKWPVEVIQNLSDVVRGVGGEVATTDKAAADEAAKSGNVPPAN
ncbi:MAG: hypothetical protein DI537_13765 [Stutzerimonas stutzeri]|nr:MAG: hypothetical protein DI537_13765 [Stutzerimonas stutzeri]